MRAIILSLTLALLLALLLSGCGGGSDGTAGSLSGTVFDAGTRQVIAGARAVLSPGVEESTNASGFFRFENAPASGSVTFAATGYLSQTLAIPAGGGDRSVGNVYLAPAPISGFGNVTGTIVEAGLVVSGAVVTAAGRTAYTDSDGNYTLYNVPAGFQTISARNPSHGTGGSLNVTVTSLSTVTANIQLTTLPPPPPVT